MDIHPAQHFAGGIARTASVVREPARHCVYFTPRRREIKRHVRRVQARGCEVRVEESIDENDLHRAMNQSPITSTSIFVRRKQSSASSGRQTTGSFSLNDVLSTIGTPLSAQNASISA